MKDNIEKFKKKWIENPLDEKGVLMYIPVSEVFISAKFGTGENLLKEDIARDFAFKEESFPFYLPFMRRNRKDPYGIKSYSFFMYKQSKRTPFVV